MAKGKITRIHGNQKLSYTRHHLAAWLEERDMKPMDLHRLLNESETEPFIDKKQVYRWLEGQLPHAPTQARIAAALGLDSAEDLHQHPNDVWIARFLRGRQPEEVRRIRESMEIAFPKKTGTNR